MRIAVRPQSRQTIRAARSDHRGRLGVGAGDCVRGGDQLDRGNGGDRERDDVGRRVWLRVGVEDAHRVPVGGAVGADRVVVLAGRAGAADRDAVDDLQFVRVSTLWPVAIQAPEPLSCRTWTSPAMARLSAACQRAGLGATFRVRVKVATAVAILGLLPDERLRKSGRGFPSSTGRMITR